MKDRPVVIRRMIAADFNSDDIAQLLLQHPDFDPTRPTVFVYEGCSMYFTAEENREIFSDSFGSMYTEVNAGSEYLLLTMQAGTTDMSNLLLESLAISELWKEFAIRSKAIIAYIDCESNSAKGVHPISKEIQLPDNQDLDLLFDNEEICIDYWGKKLIEINELQSCENEV